MGADSSTPTNPTTTIDDASMAPITEEEAAVVTEPEGKQCCFKDANELELRLRQVQIINHAIKVLSQELTKTAGNINFKFLHSSVIDIRDPEGKRYTEDSSRLEKLGRKEQGFDWSLLSEDEAFKPLELDYNRFKEFELYFQNKPNATQEEMKANFDAFLILFMRLRDALLKIMSDKCA